MRSNYSVLFYLKKNSVKKNGKSAIMGRITLNGKVAQFSTKQEIEISAWDTQNGKAKKPKQEANLINKNLDSIKNKINNYYWELYDRGEDIDAESLRNMLFGIAQKQETLLTLFDDLNKKLSSEVGITIVKATYSRYLRTRNLLATFINVQYNVSDINIRKINIQFIEDFERYLRIEKKLGTNMIYKYMVYLKKIIRKAFNNGIIKKYPFEDYKLKKEKTHVGFLTEQELTRIMSKRIEIDRLEKVRDVFIFSCFTGLAYIDIANLKKEQIDLFIGERQWIKTERIKTDNPVNIPLFRIPQIIIEKYQGKLQDDHLLPIISNQKTNTYLKELADICGIKKNLTFHMARHTFATTITLTKGVSFETVGALLGHSDLRSTRIYAEVTNEKIVNELPILNDAMDYFEKVMKMSIQ